MEQNLLIEGFFVGVVDVLHLLAALGICLLPFLMLCGMLAPSIRQRNILGTWWQPCGVRHFLKQNMVSSRRRLKHTRGWAFHQPRPPPVCDLAPSRHPSDAIHLASPAQARTKSNPSKSNPSKFHRRAPALTDNTAWRLSEASAFKRKRPSERSCDGMRSAAHAPATDPWC